MKRNGEESPNAPSGTGKADSPWRLLGLLTVLGLSVAGGVILFILSGVWFDTRFGTAPAGIIAGALLGVPAGVGAAWLSLRRFLDKI